MIQVRRLGHATISTPDMEGQIDYYGRILGLRVAEQSKDRAILVSKQGFEAIELVRGEKGQLKRLSFQIASKPCLLTRIARSLLCSATRRPRIRP